MARKKSPSSPTTHHRIDNIGREAGVDGLAVSDLRIRLEFLGNVLDLWRGG